MSVLSCPLPSEVVKGKHFILLDLLKSLPEGSSQAKAVSEPLVRSDYLPLVVQDLNLAPQAVTKKKKKPGQAKTASKGLEGFMDWTNQPVSQSIEEREVEMSGLVTGFSMLMHKRVANAKEGTILGLEVPGDKCSRPSRYDEEA